MALSFPEQGDLLGPAASFIADRDGMQNAQHIQLGDEVGNPAMGQIVRLHHRAELLVHVVDCAGGGQGLDHFLHPILLYLLPGGADMLFAHNHLSDPLRQLSGDAHEVQGLRPTA